MNAQIKAKQTALLKTRPAPRAPKKKAAGNGAEVFEQALGYAGNTAIWL